MNTVGCHAQARNPDLFVKKPISRNIDHQYCESLLQPVPGSQSLGTVEKQGGRKENGWRLGKILEGMRRSGNLCCY